MLPPLVADNRKVIPAATYTAGAALLAPNGRIRTLEFRTFGGQTDAYALTGYLFLEGVLAAAAALSVGESAGEAAEGAAGAERTLRDIVPDFVFAGQGSCV